MGYPRHIIGVKCSRRLAQIPSSAGRALRRRVAPAARHVLTSCTRLLAVAARHGAGPSVSPPRFWVGSVPQTFWSSTSNCHPEFPAQPPAWAPSTAGFRSWERCSPDLLLLARSGRPRLISSRRLQGKSHKKKQRPGWRGGNTQAAVRTKRQQTGRRGGTPSTCCLMREVCRSRTKHPPLTFQTVSAYCGSVTLQL
jgi:hypothetical protein